MAKTVFHQQRVATETDQSWSPKHAFAGTCPR